MITKFVDYTNILHGVMATYMHIKYYKKKFFKAINVTRIHKWLITFELSFFNVGRHISSSPQSS